MVMDIIWMKMISVLQELSFNVKDTMRNLYLNQRLISFWVL